MSIEGEEVATTSRDLVGAAVASVRAEDVVDVGGDHQPVDRQAHARAT